MEAMRASSNRKNTFGALPDDVGFKEYLAEEERKMRVENAVLITQGAFRNTISRISEFVEDALIALVSPEGHD